jgi:PASTA domain-containing protein
MLLAKGHKVRALVRREEEHAGALRRLPWACSSRLVLMRAALASKPQSRSHVPEKGNAERGPIFLGMAGLALIAYLFWPFVLPSDVAGRPWTEAQENNIVARVNKPQEEPTETAAPDRRGGRYRLAGLPTVVAPAASSSVPAPSTPSPTNIPAAPVASPVSVPVPPVVGQPGPSALAVLSRAGFKSRRQEEPNETISPGRVMGTLPPAGSLVDKGSTVIVTIAEPVGVLVPLKEEAHPMRIVVFGPIAGPGRCTTAMSLICRTPAPNICATGAVSRAHWRWPTDQAPVNAPVANSARQYW